MSDEAKHRRNENEGGKKSETQNDSQMLSQTRLPLFTQPIAEISVLNHIGIAGSEPKNW